MTKLRALVGLLFIAVLVYSGLWHTSGFQAEKDAAALFASWRDKGLRVDHGKIKLSGFPYRMIITVDGLRVRTRGPGLDLGAESISFISHLWTPGHWVADATNVRLSAADEAIELRDGTVRGSYRLHDDGKAIIVIDSGSTEDFALEKAPGIDEMTRLKNWQLFLRTDPTHVENESGLYEERFLDFKVMLDGGAAQFETTGGIMGPIVKDWTTEELGAWRDAGGLLEIDDFSLGTTGGRMKGSASLTLDEVYRPLGTATVQVAGGKALASTLAAVGLNGLADAIGDDPKTLSLMAQMGTISEGGTNLIALKQLIKD
ncbi:MAG: DUF2125 domain-containing protein [Alphaproteobacteria bacterium]|nr:DUF2125 domain-containing protein [Alphaproteobacteria bacterium]